MSRALKTCLMLALGLLALTGCSNHDGNEWQRLVCEVESINSGQPLVSARINVGADGLPNTADDVWPIDIVPVLFRAREYGSTIYLPEDGAYSWFHVTNYDLTWVPGPNCPDDILDYNITNGMVETVVPVHENGSASILIADLTMKQQPWFAAAVAGPGFTAACQLTFKGHESGSSQIVNINAGFMVTFIDAVSDE